ncbi:MAG: hypothetical protein JWQ30_1499 [Sediminibacterium sp.]|nr:hypothetical protein [Sediminibacterium sp.]
MTAINMREKLHQYVDKSDEKLLKLMYALAKEYNEDDDIEYEFTAEDIERFDQRRQSRLRGESKTYSVQEARDMITADSE